MSSNVSDMAAADVRIGSVLSAIALVVLLFDAWTKRSVLFPGQFGAATSAPAANPADSSIDSLAADAPENDAVAPERVEHIEVAASANQPSATAPAASSVELISERQARETVAATVATLPSTVSTNSPTPTPSADSLSAARESMDSAPSLAELSSTDALTDERDVLMGQEAQKEVAADADADADIDTVTDAIVVSGVEGSADAPLATDQDALERIDTTIETPVPVSVSSDTDSETIVAITPAVVDGPSTPAEAFEAIEPSIVEDLAAESSVIADSTYQLQGPDQLVADASDSPVEPIVVAQSEPIAVDSEPLIDVNNGYPLDNDLANSATPTGPDLESATDASAGDVVEDSDAEVVIENPLEIATARPSTRPASSATSPFERERQRELARLAGLSQQLIFPPFSVAAENETLKALDSVFEILFLYSETRVAVAVKTNEYNSDTSNQVLSRERAQTIIDYLALRGLDTTRFATLITSGSDLPRDAHEVLISATVLTE